MSAPPECERTAKASGALWRAPEGGGATKGRSRRGLPSRFAAAEDRRRVATETIACRRWESSGWGPRWALHGNPRAMRSANDRKSQREPLFEGSAYEVVSVGQSEITARPARRHPCGYVQPRRTVHAPSRAAVENKKVEKGARPKQSLSCSLFLKSVKLLEFFGFDQKKSFSIPKFLARPWPAGVPKWP